MQIYCLSANILHTQCSRNWLYAKILHPVSDKGPDPNFISLIVLTLHLVDILTQIFWAFLSWHRFSSWNTKMGSISNLDAKMLLHERAVIHKRAKILQSAIFLHLVDFIHKRKNGNWIVLSLNQHKSILDCGVCIDVTVIISLPCPISSPSHGIFPTSMLRSQVIRPRQKKGNEDWPSARCI